MKKEDIAFLSQLTDTLEESVLKLEESYSSGDNEEFNKIKGFMLKIQNQISEVIK